MKFDNIVRFATRPTATTRRPSRPARAVRAVRRRLSAAPPRAAALLHALAVDQPRHWRAAACARGREHWRQAKVGVFEAEGAPRADGEVEGGYPEASAPYTAQRYQYSNNVMETLVGRIADSKSHKKQPRRDASSGVPDRWEDLDWPHCR